MSSAAILEKMKDLMDFVNRSQSNDSLETLKVGASFDETNEIVIFKDEVLGTLYEGRTDRIENVSLGTLVRIVREAYNQDNSNKLTVLNIGGESLGYLSDEIADLLSPLIDLGYASIQGSKVSYVEQKSTRGARARKAILFVEWEVKLKKINLDNSNSCIVCLLAGDQVGVWTQKLNVIRCSIPLDHAKGLFELHNRFHSEYERIENADIDLSYVGLDNLEEEIVTAREIMVSESKTGLDYSTKFDAETFGEYTLKIVEIEPDRYGHLVQYIEDDPEEVEFESEFKYIFYNKEIHSNEYYWLDQTRVSPEEWESDSPNVYYHWYEVLELYSTEEDLPFDLEDDEIVSIFGFGRFLALADLSYGC